MSRRRMMIGKRDVGPNYRRKYLTFVALENGSFSYTRDNDKGDGATYYSTDGGLTWTLCNAAGSTTTPTISAGDEVMWKSSGITVSGTTGGSIGTFSSTGRFAVCGNIMSMQDGDDFVGSTTIGQQYQFAKLFNNASYLVYANNLIMPAMTLKNRCYNMMFRDCTSLIAVPELPAITMISYCYCNMFDGCTSLTEAPKLPATTLATYCYCNMFSNCTSLTEAPELLAETPASSCYRRMFDYCSQLSYVKCVLTSSTTNSTTDWLRGVAANGTFVKHPSATFWTIDASGIPSGWTVQNA